MSSSRLRSGRPSRARALATAVSVLAVLAVVLAACTPEPPPDPPSPPAPTPAPGTIVAWQVNVGDHVDKGTVLATLSYNGAPGTLVAPEPGTVGPNRAAAGSTFAAGAVVAELLDPHAAYSDVAGYVTLAAPGSDIWSTVPGTPGYGLKSGTSMATPAAAAVAALLIAKCPGITPAQVKARLTATALDLGAPGPDLYSGAGLVQADAAVAGSCPTLATATNAAAHTGSTPTTTDAVAPTATTTAPAPTTTSSSTSSTTTTTTPTKTTGGSVGASSATTTSPATTTTTLAPDLTAPCVSSAGGTGGTASTDSYFAVVEDDAGSRHVVTFDASDDAERHAAVRHLRAQGLEVVSVEADSTVHALALGPSDDPVYGGPPASPFGPQWGVARVSAPTAWGSGFAAEGQGVRVGVLDSGVQADHEDLGRTESGGNVAPGADCLPASVVGDERTDSGTHGTHVAGIIAARDNALGGIGIAPKATIVPVRVLNNSSGSMSDVVAGIYWAADPGQGNVDVINMSLGGSNSTALRAALQYAVAQGVTVFAAAGNCSCSNETLYPAAYASPTAGGAPDPSVGVIAVAATARRMDVTLPNQP